jgi:hypothetical protein
MHEDIKNDLEFQLNYLRRRLNELTPSLEVLLKRRGFTVFKKESMENLLLPEDKFIDSFYEMMKRYAFRLYLRDVIKQREGFVIKDVTRYATSEVTAEYTDYLLQIGLLAKEEKKYRLQKEGLISFGETLEWFISEILRREFQMESIWNVRFRGRSVGGDYDVLAKLDGGILYIEIKSSPPRQIYDRDIDAFLRRVEDLCPDMAIFLVDTHLRMKDKIVPFFEEAIKGSIFESELRRIKAELFSLRDWLFILNSKPSIEGNISSVLSYYLRRRCK